MPFVTDTQGLVNFHAGKSGKLSSKVLQVFEAAAASRDFIYVPVVVFLEIEVLRLKGLVALREGSLASWTRTLLGNPGFVAQDVTTEIVLEAAALRMIRDPLDALIVATARVLDLPLITRDRQISDSRLARIFW